LQHKALPLYGVQFHPESIATEHGHALLANFMREAGLAPRALAA
jgi:anthranilate synthase component II